MTHDAVTVRTPGERTVHRALGAGELVDWLATLEVPLTGEEQDRLLETVRALASA